MKSVVIYTIIVIYIIFTLGLIIITLPYLAKNSMWFQFAMCLLFVIPFMLFVIKNMSQIIKP